MTITHASTLDNVELTAELTRLARCEREATVALIVHLAEFDARRLFEGAGYSSLFRYCMAVLQLSEDAVYNRIAAARSARRYPGIIEELESGVLSLTTVRLLAGHLTPENQQDLLAAAAGLRKDAVEKLLAQRFPQADVAARVRKLPCRPAVSVEVLTAEALPPALSPVNVSATEAANAHPSAESEPPAVAPGPETPAPRPLPIAVTAPAVVATPVVVAAPVPLGAPVLVAASPRAIVRALAPARYEIRFTASSEMRERLRVAQDLLGHAVPSGDIAQIFDRALTLLVAELSRRKFGETKRPRQSRGQSDTSRNIPRK